MKKPTLFLVSDSTVQYYEECFFPQTGWGQVLCNEFIGSENLVEHEADNCSYPQARVYELPEIIIENRSIGGRSSRSFIEEGKFEEIVNVLDENDYMMVQFGHNDSTLTRPERYVSSEDFHIYIQKYIDVCKEKAAQCILVTPVARRNCADTEHFEISFKEYRDVMISMAGEQNLPLIDLGRVSTEYLNSIGSEESKKLYLHAKKGEYPNGDYSEGVSDDTHLSEYGAKIYAHMVSDLIKENVLLQDFAKNYLR